jgi:CheY-like chemotaxis protein
VNDPAAAHPLGVGSRLYSFQDLCRYRIHDILLVSSLYDSFTLTEDGQLSEGLLGGFLSFDLHQTPRLRRAASGREALKRAAADATYDLVIAATHVGDMGVVDLARELGRQLPDLAVIALAYDARELADLTGQQESTWLDGVFLWQGDVRILPAIVKCVEDKRNVAADTGDMGVQAIILIEDSVRYYSSFLPVIYSELMRHSQSLMPEGLNLSHKLMRLQARPKILLCTTFEEAWDYFERYHGNVLGVIADIEFPKGGVLSAEAGLEFTRRVHAQQPDVPVMLQSSLRENAALASSVDAAFLLKESPTLLHQLQQFMVDMLGFGDFVFRLPDGTVVGRARDLRGLESQLRVVPAASLAYHGARNHFSKWLKARTEFALAHRLRPRKVSDFPTIEHLRTDLIDAIQEYRLQRNRTVIADFAKSSFDPAASFCRIGGGSLGGKGRGLAFINYLLEQSEVRTRFRDVQIAVPPSVVLGADVFDRLLDSNGLRDELIREQSDAAVLNRLLRASFPEEVLLALAEYLELATYPLAVRSSSLLEDSAYQPFAGIYDTHMVANRDADLGVRLDRLREAICRVYASTFSQRAKAYLSTSPYRLEEEKMAVVIQRITGITRGTRHYPDLSGVACSHNSYPLPPMRASDGIAAVALGLGATVVNAEPCFRFCPRYPRHVLQFSSTADVLQNSQRMFYALNLDNGVGLDQYGLEIAEADRALIAVGSTYSPENDAVFDGVSRTGVRLVSFAPILKHGLFPLAELLSALLEIGEYGMGGPVEIEFAANVVVPPGQPREFAFLQIRPLTLAREAADLDVEGHVRSSLVCGSHTVLGHGRLDHLRDAIVVDSGRFVAARSQEIAAELSRLNGALVHAGTPYALFVVGRLGSSEPTLGLPVTWDQIAGAQVIVESGFRDFKVTPSQGSHFFHHLMTLQVGYFTANPDTGDGFVDWEWLAAQPARSERAGVRHVRFESPLVVKMNGQAQTGVIVKPEENGLAAPKL